MSISMRMRIGELQKNCENTRQKTSEENMYCYYDSCWVFSIYICAFRCFYCCCFVYGASGTFLYEFVSLLPASFLEPHFVRYKLFCASLTTSIWKKRVKITVTTSNIPWAATSQTLVLPSPHSKSVQLITMPVYRRCFLCNTPSNCSKMFTNWLRGIAAIRHTYASSYPWTNEHLYTLLRIHFL